MVSFHRSQILFLQAVFLTEAQSHGASRESQWLRFQFEFFGGGDSFGMETVDVAWASVPLRLRERQSRNPFSDSKVLPMSGCVLRLALEIRFCENTQLIPLRRRYANRALPITLRRSFFMDYPRVPTTSSPAVIPCSAPPAHGPEEVIANLEFRMITA